MTAAEISALLVSYGNIRHPLALNKLGCLLQKHGFVPRRTMQKRGYTVILNQDLDNQRKLDARAASDSSDSSDSIF